MEVIEYILVTTFSRDAANGDLWGRNGPILQFSGKAEELEFGASQFEFSIEVRRELVVDLELRQLGVTQVGASGLHTGLHAS